MSLEYSFIQFSETIPTVDELSLPIVKTSDFKFLVDNWNEDILYIFLLGKDGSTISYRTPIEFTVTKGDSQTFITITNDIELIMGEFVRIGLVGNTYAVASNLFQVVEESGTSLLKYHCDESQFGFDYTITVGDATSYNQIRLPIRLYNAQYPQKETVYIGVTGNRQVLSAKINKEYQLETEYMPEEWHEKLIIALAHDHVEIDGVEVFKTSEYEINWNEYTDQKGYRLTKGSTKMQNNFNQRNTNCG